MKKKAFTLIELLVVIAIIGVLATISVIALSNARAKARDSKRAGNIKQVQTALEMFYNDKGRYPTEEEWATGKIFTTTTNSTTTYMQIIPSASTPIDGSCTEEQNDFYYTQTQGGNSYTISFCLGGRTGTLASGPKCLTPGGIVESDCSSSGHSAIFQASIVDYLSSSADGLGSIAYGSGDYDSVSNQHTIQVYPFKLIGGNYYVSDPASGEATDDGSSGDYHINWSWTASPEADGYLVLKDDTYSNQEQQTIVNQAQDVEENLNGRDSSIGRINNLLDVIINNAVSLSDIDAMSDEILGLCDSNIGSTLSYLISNVDHLPASVATDLQDLIDANTALRAEVVLMKDAPTVPEAKAYAAIAKGMSLDLGSDMDALESYAAVLKADAEEELARTYYKIVYTNSLDDTGYSIWSPDAPTLSYFPYGAWGYIHVINVYYYKTIGGLKDFSSYYSETTLTDDLSNRYYDINYSWNLGDNDGVRLFWGVGNTPPITWYYQDIEGGTSIRASELTNLQAGDNPPVDE